MAVGQAITGSDDRAPWDAGVRILDLGRDVRRSLADQFNVAQRGVVRPLVGNEGSLIEAFPCR